MTAFNKKALWILLLGDIVAFVLSLWITLSLRYVETAGKDIFVEHLVPFSFLFVVWIVVFFISGLYDKQSLVLKSILPGPVIQAQVVNILIATAFFYFIPWYGISPKTTLFLYLLISLCLILVWRIYGFFLVAPISREKAVVIGSGEEAKELSAEIKRSKHYKVELVCMLDVDREPTDSIVDAVRSSGATLVIMDPFSQKVTAMFPRLYDLLFSEMRFIGMDRVYEDVFDRMPLSLLKYDWFIENISASPKGVYDTLKRLMDIVLSLILGILSLSLYPFVFLAIKLDDGGRVFISQERVGKNNKMIRIYKFRSMSKNDMGVYGKDQEENRITNVGRFLRKSRIDELPQLWNVLKGDISLIGPRPELPALVRVYEDSVPFYNIRHIIKPGLSGWAQIYHENHPHHEQAVEATKEKLSYDLFYIKNRSFLLDLNIALKTIKALVSRKGA